MQWLITYLKENDYNAQQYQKAITAATYTEAYINFMVDYNDPIILEIKKI